MKVLTHLVWLSGSSFLLLTQGVDDAGDLGGLGGKGVSSLADLCLHCTGRLGQENFAGLEVREFGDLCSAQSASVKDTALDN